MRRSVIEGIGTVYGDTYDELRVEGIGKLKGDANAKIVSIEGLFKGKGRITTDKLICEGIARIFKDIKAREVRIEGVMKLRGCKLEADSLYCDGIIVCNREISADNINIDGICSVAKMYGDNIKIHYNFDNCTWQKLPVKEKSLFKLYFGRDLSLDFSTVDYIECTRLEAEGLHAKSIKAHYIKLGPNCVVDNIDCDREIEVHPSCRIGKSNIDYRKNEEVAEMAGIRIAEVLEKYKKE